MCYSAALTIRRALYALGAKKRHRLPVIVVSVGNLTLGGTGKTPMVAWLANRFGERGLPVTVVSRGYGRRSEAETIIVSRWGEILVSVEEGGDEPLMLARTLPKASVVVASRRVDGARMAVEELGARLVILDDGFQHWALFRDLDIVLVSGEEGFGNGLLFPAGPLREPLSALNRAHIAVVTKCRNTVLEREISMVAPQLPIFTASIVVREIRAPMEGRTIPLGKVKGIEAAAFSGIAFPDSFFRLLSNVGVILRETRAYPDHHFYTVEDVKGLSTMAHRWGTVFTTEKDWVRIENMNPEFSPLVVKIEMDASDSFFEAVWARCEDGG